TKAELAFLLSDSGVRVLFVTPHLGDRDYVADLSALIPEAVSATPGAWRSPRFPKLETLVVIGENAPRGWLTYQAVVSAKPPSDVLPPGESAAANDDAFVLYTSGSSSTPKAVRLSHHGVIENGFNIGERQGLRPGDRVLLAPPLFWSYGSANALPAALTH